MKEQISQRRVDSNWIREDIEPELVCQLKRGVLKHIKEGKLSTVEALCEPT